MGNSWLRGRRNGNVSVSGCGEPIPPSTSSSGGVAQVRKSARLSGERPPVRARSSPLDPTKPHRQTWEGMRWLADPSESSVRQALAAAAPRLANARIELSPDVDTSNPEWSSSTATVDGSFIVKFAWSEAGATRVVREALVLETLSRVAPELPVPRPAGISTDPVAFVTPLVRGTPLRFDDVRRCSRDDRAAIADGLASFLATLHQSPVLDAVRAAVPSLPAPHPQATTQAIRERLPRFLDRRRADLVLGWCDWVDEILCGPAPQPVLAHGDLHGFNQVWRRGSWTLLLVADLEVAGPADPEYDFRYFPSQEPTLGLVTAIREKYMALSGRTIDLKRAFAWHIRTALGDALWRSDAGVPLPDGGTPATYVDDIELKLDMVAVV
jgi:aminoglycoside phosphotransferase (APT) family kinase protein